MWIALAVGIAVSFVMLVRAWVRLNPRKPGHCSICGEPGGDHDDCRIQMSAW
jgi:hypothetical protein